MRLPRITLKQVEWLLAKPEFRHFPIKTLSQIVKWQFIRVLNQPILFEFDDSLGIRLFPDHDDIATHTYYFGSHEPEVLRFLDKFLKKGMLFVDVGANIGTYTLFAAKRVGAEGKVFAFEPQEETFHRLQENIQLNKFKNTVSEKVAIGDRVGEVELLLNHKYTANSYTRQINNEIKIANTSKMTSLDAYLRTWQVQSIDYLKIDVEGFELDVLKGGAYILTKIVPSIIQIELIEELQKRNGSSNQMIRQFLQDLGYHIFCLEESSLKLIPIPTQNQHNYDNAFLIHETKLAQMTLYL